MERFSYLTLPGVIATEQLCIPCSGVHFLQTPGHAYSSITESGFSEDSSADNELTVLGSLLQTVSLREKIKGVKDLCLRIGNGEMAHFGERIHAALPADLNLVTSTYMGSGVTPAPETPLSHSHTHIPTKGAQINTSFKIKK